MDMHNILHEFEFRPDETTDYGVTGVYNPLFYCRKLRITGRKIKNCTI